jgi:hypothetical protein
MDHLLTSRGIDAGQSRGNGELLNVIDEAGREGRNP